ncbi:ABC transporter ATP-binding protein/permease [bacterium]|nr:ABC transporter ATP-binding protein/permease [bacterium]
MEAYEFSESRTADLHVLKHLIPYIKRFKWLVVLSLFTSLTATFVTAIQPKLMKTAIDVYILNNDFPGLLRLGYLLIGLLVLSFSFNFLRTYTTYLLAQNTILGLRSDIYQQLLLLSDAYLSKTPLGVLITRTANDTENLSELMSAGAIELINDFILLSISVIILFTINWQLTIIALFFSPFVVVTIFYFSRILREAYNKARNNLTWLNIFLQENLSGISLIKLYSRKTLSSDDFKHISNEYKTSVLSALSKDILFNQIINFSSFLSRLLVIFVGGWMILNDKISLGSLPAFLMYVEYFYNPLRNLGERFNIIQDAAVSMTKINTVLNQKEIIPEPLTPNNQQIIGNIEFDHVGFGYVEQEVLHKISLSIKQGQRIAIVGPTGSGKTTIMNLILRLYDVKDGSIRLDGVDIRDYSLSYLRSHIAIVLQDVFIFKGTVLENITLGRTDISEDEIINAAKYLNAHDFILQLPRGYRTEINTEGSNLSLGQKQLISFIRALVIKPKILLLDEATSSVDTQTERLIQEGIEKLMQGRTSIAIAHRLSTIIHSDRIIVLKDGNIIEEGSHDQLIDLHGFYWKLYTTQFSKELT